MRRREFLLGASAATGAAVATAPAAAQESPTPSPGGTATGSPEGTATGSPEGTATDGEGGGSGATVEVKLVDFAFEPGTDSPLTVPPGTTVTFTWETNGHNIHVDSKPSGSDWQGHEPIEDAGFSVEHTFTTTGDYHYWCAPHKSLGMVGDITVEEGAALPGEGAEGGVPEEVDPEEMGVPIQAHFVGLATILMLVVALVFTFFLLKYGETPHSGYPKR